MEREKIAIPDMEEEVRAPPPREMVDLESRIEKMEADLLAINGNEETLRQNFLELTELKHILHKTQTFFDEVRCFAAASSRCFLSAPPHPLSAPPPTTTSLQDLFYTLPLPLSNTNFTPSYLSYSISIKIVLVEPKLFV